MRIASVACRGAAWRCIRWLCSVLPFAGCGAFSWEERRVDDEGHVCLSAEAFPFGSALVRLDENAPLTVKVVAPTCLSSTCSRDAHGSCDLVRRDQELLVTSRFVWEEKTRGSCTDDCGQLSATCSSEPLPAGNYAVRHGAEQHALVIPSRDLPACLPPAVRSP